MTFLEQIQNYLPILTTFVIIVAWFIRLESITMINKRDLAKIQARNELKDALKEA